MCANDITRTKILTRGEKNPQKKEKKYPAKGL